MPAVCESDSDDVSGPPDANVDVAEPRLASRDKLPLYYYVTSNLNWNFGAGWRRISVAPPSAHPGSEARLTWQMYALTCALSLSFVQDHGARPGLPWALFKMGPDLRLALKAASLPVSATVRWPATRCSCFRL